MGTQLLLLRVKSPNVQSWGKTTVGFWNGKTTLEMIAWSRTETFAERVRERDEGEKDRQTERQRERERERERERKNESVSEERSPREA